MSRAASSVRDCSVASTIGQAMGSEPTCCKSLARHLPLYPFLVSEYGEKPVWSITMVYGFIKGIAVQSVLAASLPILKDGFKVSPATYQRYSVVAVNAWALKPALGLMSDNLPLAGYHKRTYMLFAVVSASVSILAMAALPTLEVFAIVFAGFVFATNLSFATLDLLTEGTYSALMIQKPHTGASFVSWVWGCCMFGSIIAAGLVGPLADAGMTRLTLWILLPLVASILVPVAKNWVDEIAVRRVVSLIPNITELKIFFSKLWAALRVCKFRWKDDPNARLAHHHQGAGARVAVAAGARRKNSKGAELVPSAASTSSDESDAGVAQPQEGLTPEEAADAAREQLERDNLCISFYGFCVAKAAMILATVSLFHVTRTLRFSIALTTTATLSGMSFLFLPPIVAKANLYFFLKEALYVQIPGAMDYYFTTTECPHLDTPKFSYFYYQTFTMIVGNVAGVFGVSAFQKFLSKRNFQFTFYLTVTLKIVASLFDVLIISRWNKTKLGLSDHATYLLGDAIVFSMCYMLDFMPATVLIAKLCPPGLESTMFALLAGFSNFGQAMSQTIGSGLIEHYMPAPAPVQGKEVPNCNFGRLPELVLLAHCFLPLLVIPLIWLLIPSAKVSDFNEGSLQPGSGGETRHPPPDEEEDDRMYDMEEHDGEIGSPQPAAPRNASREEELDELEGGNEPLPAVAPSQERKE